MRRALAALALALSSSANATILVNQGFLSDPYFIGSGGNMEGFTADLASQVGGFTLGDLEDASAVNAANALFINVRSFDIGSYGDPVGQDQQFTTAEIANIEAFLSTGKRVVIIGENGSFLNWDRSIIDLASGGAPDPIKTTDGPQAALLSDEITEGVPSLNVVAGGGHTTGGTNLYENGLVTIWRPQKNLITIFDVNVLDDTYGNVRFEQNVAGWLGESAVPETGSWMMMIAGFGLVGATFRRSKTQPASQFAL